MKRMTAVLMLLAAAAPVRAHFIWIIPIGEERKGQVIFSDELQPDERVPIAKIAKTKLFLCKEDFKTEPVKWSEIKHAYEVALPGKGSAVVEGLCEYGVVQKGDNGPFRLVYCARSLLGVTLREDTSFNCRRSGELPLEILLLDVAEEPLARVMWKGKRLAEAEVIVHVPGLDKEVNTKTDSRGYVDLPAPKAAGVYGIRARHVEKVAGEHQGKKYGEVRYYTTLTVRVAPVAPKAKESSSRSDDPKKTNLLREDKVEGPLASLEDRCQKLLKMQMTVYDGTKSLHKVIEGTADKKPRHTDKQALLKLSHIEKDLIVEATKAIDMLKKEGSAVAFTEVFEQLREDMKHVKRRLEMSDAGSITQALERDSIDTLQEMIAALKKS